METNYEIGWCIAHDDLAKMYPDGSWGCWWESTVETKQHGDYDHRNFHPLRGIDDQDS